MVHDLIVHSEMSLVQETERSPFILTYPDTALVVYTTARSFVTLSDNFLAFPREGVSLRLSRPTVLSLPIGGQCLSIGQYGDE